MTEGFVYLGINGEVVEVPSIYAERTAPLVSLVEAWCGYNGDWVQARQVSLKAPASTG